MNQIDDSVFSDRLFFVRNSQYGQIDASMVICHPHCICECFSFHDLLFSKIFSTVGPNAPETIHTHHTHPCNTAKRIKSLSHTQHDARCTSHTQHTLHPQHTHTHCRQLNRYCCEAAICNATPGPLQVRIRAGSTVFTTFWCRQESRLSQKKKSRVVIQHGSSRFILPTRNGCNDSPPRALCKQTPANRSCRSCAMGLPPALAPPP